MYDPATKLLLVVADYFYAAAGQHRPFFVAMDAENGGIVRKFVEHRGTEVVVVVADYSKITPAPWFAGRTIFYAYKLWFEANSSYVYNVASFCY